MPAQFIDHTCNVDMSSDPTAVEIVYLADFSGQTHSVADTGDPAAKWKISLSQRIAFLSGAPSQLGQTAQPVDCLLEGAVG